ncbi:MAG: hypothetical protein WD674_05105 [Cucumibacter sp.]
MRGVGDPVDDADRAGPGDLAADLGGRINLADDVGGVREGDEPDPRIEQPVEVFRIEMTGLGIDPPFADLEGLGGQPPQRSGIGFVVLVGDNDCGAGSQIPGEGAGKHIGVLRGRGAEMDRLGWNVEELAHPLMGKIHRLARFGRGGEGRVGLDLQATVIGEEPVEDLRARVGTARVFKEPPAGERRLGEGGEMRPDGLRVERQWD